jgi:beta-galactosidase
MKMKLGTSYYPECYDASQWEGDLRLMKETGLEVIRIFDFAWTTVERKEGVYEWEWLDAFLDLCDEVGMRVILCTPTATPPPWLYRQNPEIMSVRRDGTAREFGGRRGMCNTNAVYRDYSVGIARRMAERYGQRETLVGWQIDNELMGPGDNDNRLTECHCDACTTRFRSWLKERYARIEDVNDAWGLHFWNQAYGDWEDIITPRHKHCVNGWVIDYTEFMSDMTAEFMKLQYDVIKSLVRPEQWVVTNSTGVMNIGFDHRKFSRLMDAGAWDSYPGCAGVNLPDTYTALAHDMFRSATFTPFHVLETASSGIRPAFLAEAFARGAKTTLFWHWRCIPYGPENHADTLCHYDGTPKPGRLETIRAFKAKLDAIPPPPSEIPRQETAFIYDQTNTRNTRRLETWRESNYLTTQPKAYHYLWQHGIPVDVVTPLESLDGYKLAVVPSLQLIDEATAEQLTEFVRNGGILWACAPFAQRDHHAKWLQDRSAWVSEMLGLEQLDTHARGETRVKVSGVGCQVSGESVPS